MSDPDIVTGIKKVSADKLIEAYAELKETGQLSDLPVVAAAYVEIQGMLDFLKRHGVADVEYHGNDLMKLIGAAQELIASE